MDSPAQQRRSYLVYGIRLDSSYEFRFPLPLLEPNQGLSANAGGGKEAVGSGGIGEHQWPTFRFEVVEASGDLPIPPAAPVATGSTAEPVFDDRRQVQGGVAGCAVYVTGDLTLMRFNDAADFYLRPGHITCHLYDERYGFAIEIWLLGTVLAHLLEQEGTLVLHASAVEIDGRAVGFLASNKGGKSSLAAAFVQANHRLLSDDLVGLRLTDQGVMALPGYPQMRMWPSQAERLLGSTEGLARVQPGVEKLMVPLTRVASGRFCSKPLPLAALFLPERGADEPRPVIFERLAAAEAMAQLALHSFLAPMFLGAETVAKRFRGLAKILNEVQVLRLRYPSGVGRLPDVVSQVLEAAVSIDSKSKSSDRRGFASKAAI